MTNFDISNTRLMSEPKMRVNKKLIILMILVLFSVLACNNNQQEGQNNTGELKNEDLALFNYPRPVVVDTASFFLKGESFKAKHYHINAYSEIDTADIQFYVAWSDSILNELKDGRRSHIFFFNNKVGTPKIPLPTVVSHEGYKKHCFLRVSYDGNTKDYDWEPF